MVTDRLHPDMRAMFDRRKASGAVGFADGTPADARRGFAEGQAAMPRDRGAAVRTIEDFRIEGPRGQVPIRHYLPETHAPVGRILYIHGGGWVFGTLDGFDPICRELANASGAEVFSVDYRLAPEFPFPAPLDDAWAALIAIADGGPLAVAGDSAGGNLAAALTLRARSRGGPTIDLQLLLYPAVDDDFTRPSYRAFGNGDFLISIADMKWFWDHHVAAEHRTNPEAVPARETDLVGLPDAIIVVGGCDPLHDEGVAYAHALETAGVNVVLRDHPDMAHGFCTLIDLLGPANGEARLLGSLIAERWNGD